MGFIRSPAGRSLSFLAFLLAGVPAPAQVWHWPTVEYIAAKTGKTEWVVHWRAEIQGVVWRQVRIGPVMYYALNSRTDWTAGYYYIRDKGVSTWPTAHRLFTGVETVVARPGPARFRFRSWVELQMPDSQPNYVRFRERLLFRTAWAVAPFASVEIFFDNLDGYRETRYSAGLRWRMGPWLAAEVGYRYDSRAARLGPNRNVITSTWTIGRPRKAAPVP